LSWLGRNYWGSLGGILALISVIVGVDRVSVV
jgi:hypothetical protein